MSALELPATTDSVPVARRFVRVELRHSEADVDTAVLLTSEVVTNAVLHARSPFRLVVEDRESNVRIAVHDRSPVPPRMHNFSPLSATGRGLRLLDHLALAWGVESADSGKTVWFEVGQPSDAAWESFTADDLLAEGAVSDF